MKLKKIAALSLAGLAFMSTSSFANNINDTYIQSQNLQGGESDMYDFAFDFLSDKSILPFPVGAFVKDVFKGPLKGLLFPSQQDPTQAKLDQIQKLLKDMTVQLNDITLIDKEILNQVIELSSNTYDKNLRDKVEQVDTVPNDIFSKNKLFLPRNSEDTNKDIYPFPVNDNKGIYEYAKNLYSSPLSIKETAIANMLKNQFVDVNIESSEQVKFVSNDSQSLINLYDNYNNMLNNSDVWLNFYTEYENYMKDTQSNDELLYAFYKGNFAYGQVDLNYTQSAVALYNMFKVLIAFKYTHPNDFKYATIPNGISMNIDDGYAGYQKSIEDLSNVFKEMLNDYQTKVVNKYPAYTQKRYMDEVLNSNVLALGKNTKLFNSQSLLNGCDLVSVSMPANNSLKGLHIGHMTLSCGNKINHFDIPYNVDAAGKRTAYVSGIHLTINDDPLKPDYIYASSEYHQLKDFVSSRRDNGWTFRGKYHDWVYGNVDAKVPGVRNDLSANLHLSGEVIQSYIDKPYARLPAKWITGFEGYYAYPKSQTNGGGLGLDDFFFIHTENGHIFSSENWIRLKDQKIDQLIVMSCLIGDKSCHADKEGQSMHWDDGTTIAAKQSFIGDEFGSGSVKTTAYTTADFTDKVILDGHVYKNNKDKNNQAFLEDGQTILTSKNGQYQLAYNIEKGSFNILNRETGEKKPAFSSHGSQAQNIKSIKFEHGNVDLYDQYGGQIWTAQTYTFHDGVWIPSAIKEENTNYISLQDDGNLVVCDKNATPLWSNNKY